MSPRIIQHYGCDNYSVVPPFDNRKKSNIKDTAITALLLRTGCRGRRPLQFCLQQILSNGRTLFAPTVVRASLLCRKIATLFADLHLIGERVAVQILSLRYDFVFVLYFGQLCSFLIPHSSLIPLFQIFYFFKMNIFSAARNNSNSRKRHILNRKDLCYEKIIRYAYLPQPLRYHARRLFKK